MDNRPKGVLIVTIIVFIAAILALIIGISIIIPGTPLDVIWTLKNSFPIGFKSTFIGIIFGYFLLALGLIMLYSAYGLTKGRKWAWWITVIIFTVNGIGYAVSVALGSSGSDGITGILIAVVFLFYLTRPSVKNYFEK
jgi:uncharacterized BrkB/YihY/UPF0761 family membrane protein